MDRDRSVGPAEEGEVDRELMVHNSPEREQMSVVQAENLDVAGDQDGHQSGVVHVAGQVHGGVVSRGCPQLVCMLHKVPAWTAQLVTLI